MRALDGSFPRPRNEGDARVGRDGQVLACRVPDLLAGDGPKADEIVQLVVQRGGRVGDAVGGGHAVGRLVGEGVIGLRPGDRQGGVRSRLRLRDVRRRGLRLRHRLHDRHAGRRAGLSRPPSDHHQRADPGRGTQVPARHGLRAHRLRSGAAEMNRRALAFAGLFVLLLPVAAFAQPTGITRSRLPNGFTVVVRENPAAPVVGYSLLVKMGTRTETPDDAGISNMLQIMLVRGTEKMSGEEIVSAADRMGGTIDAYGDEDYSEITATALSRNWQSMLELVGDVALRPTVPDGTLTGVRDF